MLVAEFLASDEAEDLSDREAASRCADHIVDYGCDQDFGRPLRMSPAKVEAFLLDWLPRKVMLSPAEQHAMPHVLLPGCAGRAMREGRDTKAIGGTLDAVFDAMGTFTRVYHDPVSFGLEPRLVARLLPDCDLEALPRRVFAFPLLRGSYHGTDLATLDPASPRDRRILLAADHDDPSGRAGSDHIDRHLALADRLWRGDPPELWDAAQRLLDLGRGPARGAARADGRHPGGGRRREEDRRRAGRPAAGGARGVTAAPDVIDLNADLGESFGAWRLGDDDALLAIVTSANIACGFHAGDPLTIRRACAGAIARGVSIGAQVSYRDLAGFGRREMTVPPEELTAEVLYQIAALDGIARTEGGRVSYVKPHGALYNRCVRDAVQAAAVAEAIRAYDPALPLLTLPGGEAVKAAADAGLTVVAEAFADRAYHADGTLVPRGQPGAVISDPGRAAAARRPWPPATRWSPRTGSRFRCGSGRSACTATPPGRSRSPARSGRRWSRPACAWRRSREAGQAGGGCCPAG